MKVINLNESQYKRLFEVTSTAAGLGDTEQNTIKPGIGSEVYITGKGENDKNGVFDFEQPDSDEFAGQQATQNNWVGRRGALGGS